MPQTKKATGEQANAGTRQPIPDTHPPHAPTVIAHLNALKLMLPAKGQAICEPQAEKIKKMLHHKSKREIQAAANLQRHPMQLTFLMRLMMSLSHALVIAEQKKQPLRFEHHIALILYLLSLPFIAFLNKNSEGNNILSILEKTSIPDKSLLAEIRKHLEAAMFEQLRGRLLPTDAIPSCGYMLTFSDEDNQLYLARRALNPKTPLTPPTGICRVTDNNSMTTTPVDDITFAHLFTQSKKTTREFSITPRSLIIAKEINDQYPTFAIALETLLQISISLNLESRITLQEILTAKMACLCTAGLDCYYESNDQGQPKLILKFNWAPTESKQRQAKKIAQISTSLESCLRKLAQEDAALLTGSSPSP